MLDDVIDNMHHASKAVEGMAGSNGAIAMHSGHGQAMASFTDKDGQTTIIESSGPERKLQQAYAAASASAGGWGGGWAGASASAGDQHALWRDDCGCLGRTSNHCRSKQGMCTCASNPRNVLRCMSVALAAPHPLLHRADCTYKCMVYILLLCY
jgi:hypothetical protein